MSLSIGGIEHDEESRSRRTTLPQVAVTSHELRQHPAGGSANDATRGVWHIGPYRERARYAFAVYQGIVREVYAISQWLPARSTFSTRNPHGVRARKRWEFVGTLAPEHIRAKYIGLSVAHSFNKTRSPFIYHNVPER